MIETASEVRVRRIARVVIAACVVVLVAMTSVATLSAQVEASGHPVVADCDRQRDVAVRLSRDMFNLDDKIQKLQEQAGHLHEARKNPELEAKARQADAEAAIETALLVSKLNEFRALIDKLPLKAAARVNIVAALDGLDTSYQYLYKNPKAFKELAEADVDTMTQKLTALHHLLEDTGAYEHGQEAAIKLAKEAVEPVKEMAEHLKSEAFEALAAGKPMSEVLKNVLAGKGLDLLADGLGGVVEVAEGVTGPLGQLVIEEGKWAIDKIYSDELSFQNLLDENAVTDTLSVLRRQKDDILLQAQFVMQYCKLPEPPRSEPKKSAPPPGPTPAPPPTPPHHSNAVLWTIVGTTVGGVTAAELYAQSQQAGSTDNGGGSGSLSVLNGTVTCSTSNVPFGSKCSGSMTIKNNGVSKNIGQSVFASGTNGGLVARGTMPGDGATSVFTFASQANAVACPRDSQFAVAVDLNSDAFALASGPVTFICQ